MAPEFSIFALPSEEALEVIGGYCSRMPSCPELMAPLFVMFVWFSAR